MSVIWSLMFIFVIICYYDLPTDKVPNINPKAINDSYASSIQNSEPVPTMKQLPRKTSFVDKIVLWKGIFKCKVLAKGLVR